MYNKRSDDLSQGRRDGMASRIGWEGKGQLRKSFYLELKGYLCHIIQISQAYHAISHVSLLKRLMSNNASPMQAWPYPSSVELPSLHIDTVLSNSHTQIFHGQYSPILTPTLSSTTITRSLNTKWSSSTSLLFASGSRSRLARNWKSSRRTKITHGIIGVWRIWWSNTRILICICCYIGDEFLCCERQ